MKEFDMFLQTFSACLKSMAQGFEAMVKMMEVFSSVASVESVESKEETGKETIAEPTPVTAPETEAKAPVSPPAEKPANLTAKKGGKPPEKPITATETVIRIINQSKEGVDTATLTNQTGFEAKKIHNILYKLKKRGIIKSEKKGVYQKV